MSVFVLSRGGISHIDPLEIESVYLTLQDAMDEGNAQLLLGGGIYHYTWHIDEWKTGAKIPVNSWQRWYKDPDWVEF